MNSIDENSSPNNSDTDDWTLLSPPHSESSYSPEQDILISPTSSSTNSSLEHINNDVEERDDEDDNPENKIDDGLTEIDLTSNNYDTIHGQCSSKNITLAVINENDDIHEDNEHLQTRTSSSEPSMSGFQPIDTTEDECVGSESSYQAQTESSSTESEPGDNVDLTKKELILYKLSKEVKSNNANNDLLNIKTSRKKQVKSTDDDGLTLIHFIYIFVISCLLTFILAYLDNAYDLGLHRPNHVILKITEFPTSQQKVELKLLFDELDQCIKRQNPSFLEYYISEEQSNQAYLDDINNYRAPSFKHLDKTLVCYGQETRWRNRLKQLKDRHNLDLPDLVEQYKRNVTNLILEKYHSAFQYRLILNQIEYLKSLEKKREKKQSEEIIKYLRAENLKLLRLLNQPNDTGYQKLFVDLELKNSQLIRENKALKASLTQKAGTIYIQQSNKLDELDRENILLKQFHNQVAKDVSKSLKQFHLHTVDATTNLNDIESLNSQLILTKNHLSRLTDRVSKVLLENESLKEELKENHLLTTSLVNRVNAENGDSKLLQVNESNNNSNALIADSCMRNLANLKEKTDILEQEMNQLRKNCNKLSCNVDLERSFGHHLNKTDKNHHDKSYDWERLGLTQGQQQTAIDKHNERAFSLKNDDIVDELMVFLTKFNNQVESNSLAIVNHLQLGEAGYLTGSQKLIDNEIKVLPNYLREIYVQQKKKNSLIDDDNNFAKLFSDTEQATITMNLPPTPPTINEFSFPESRTNYTKTKVEHTLEDSKKSTLENNMLNSTFYNEDSSVNCTTQALRDSWFFKRAKQRKQLRQNKEDIQTSWIYKRAKLREKLRKASSYIDDTYVNQCIGHYLEKLPISTLLSTNINSKRHHQSTNSKQHQQNKNKHKQERIHNNHHNYHQRHNNNRNYRNKNYHNNHHNVYNHEEL